MKRKKYKINEVVNFLLQSFIISADIPSFPPLLEFFFDSRAHDRDRNSNLFKKIKFSTLKNINGS